MTERFQSLTLKGAVVERDGQRLLGPIDLSLDSSGITCVLGHNGAGKSLFLKMCHGQFSPNSGSVTWDGKAAITTRRRRSFMFQGSPVLLRSVAANVEYPLIAHGVKKPERQKRLHAALKLARLSDRASAPAASLSGGERQRMSLARAWVTEPSVIILDEPAASLDPASTKELETLVREISASGVKVLIATHDLAQARRLADDVLMFGRGNLLAFEPAERFFSQNHEGEIANYLNGRL